MMGPLALSSALAVLLHLSAAYSAISFSGDAVCVGQITLAETYIGQDKNVKMQYASCPDFGIRSRVIDVRQTVPDVCGTPCGTNCFPPSGGGPDPNDCHIIADALRYDSQNISALFQVDTGTNNTIIMKYSSCLSFFVNQDSTAIEYCRTDWASLIDFVAPNCQATQNAHGGNCIASDQRWFVQVQHS
ncbi:hypothetical protein C8R44DRAFT_758874 [Mycena epipterygia]|nr:hypothetical protein C8R44DRAFT_758874 [Mycena epipterygia]